MLTDHLKIPFVVMALAAGLFLSGIPALQAADVDQEKAPAAESESRQAATPVKGGKMAEERMRPDIEETLKEIKESIKAMQKGQADAGADMTAVGDQIRQLRGEVEEIGKNLESLRNERREIESKLRDLSSSIKVMETLLGLRNGKTEPKRWEEKPTPIPKGDKAAESSEDEQYVTAFEDFREGRSSEARARFQKYLAEHPGSKHAGDAQFWIGESYYLEKEYEKAILEYEKVIKDYPDSDKIPHALLGQGFSFSRLGDAASAKLFFKKLVDDFPNTLQARVAKKQLKPQKDQPVPPKDQVEPPKDTP